MRMQYIDFVWLLLRYLLATKENNFSLHMAPLDDMCLLLFSYEHPNYARYTVVYVLNMLILRKTHTQEEELLIQNGFSVPCSRN